MPTKRRPSGRDSRYSRTIGEKPFVGRRYVENGRVRIEWKEDGKRRRRTIGPNSASTRSQADAELEEILARMQNDNEQHEQEPQDQQPPDAEQHEQEEQQTPPALGTVLRDYVLAAIGVADGIADWVHDAITSPVEWEWVEESDGSDGKDKSDGNDGKDGSDGENGKDGDDVRE